MRIQYTANRDIVVAGATVAARGDVIAELDLADGHQEHQLRNWLRDGLVDTIPTTNTERASEGSDEQPEIPDD